MFDNIKNIHTKHFFLQNTLENSKNILYTS